MKFKNILILISILIVAISFISAAFEVDTNTISSKYAENSFLKGSIKISFLNEPLDSIFTDSFNNNISLSEILENNPEFKYNCTTSQCQSTYDVKNPESSKIFHLESGEEKVIGFRLAGNIEAIQSSEFRVSSNAQQSNQNQLKIDILDDGTYETGNTGVGTSTSQYENLGCFKETEAFDIATLDQIPYCQKLTIYESPALLLGLWVQEEIPGTANITMSIYDKEGNLLIQGNDEYAECNLPKSQINSEGKMVYCQVNVLIPETDDYYICSYLSEENGTYNVRAYTGIDENLKCGFKGTPVKNPVASYHMGVRTRSFAEFSPIVINDTLPTGEIMSELFRNYIRDKYGSMDCTYGCYVPIKFSSFSSQDITVSNPLLIYDTIGAGGIKVQTLNDFDVVGALINAESQNLKLDNFFQVPSKVGNYSYKLNLNSEEILEKEITVEKISTYLNIKKTASSYPNNFIVTISPQTSVKEYRWDFGDNTTLKTFGNEASHTYQTIGNFTLSVVIVDSEGAEFSAEFKVSVQSPKELIAYKIKEFETNLANLKTQIKLLDSRSQQVLSEELNLTEIEQKISFLKEKQKVAQTVEDDEEMIAIILDISIPEAVFQTSTAKVPFYIKKDDIDFDAIYNYIGYVSPEGKEDEVKNAIIFWAQKNIHTRVSTKQILVKEDGETNTRATIFEVTISPKEYLDSNFYVYVEDLYGIKLTGSNFEEIDDYKVFSLIDETTISISGPDISIEDLPIFIVPEVSKLVISSDVAESEEGGSKFLLFFLVMLALVFLAVFAYLIMQKWYKVKYEKYLFKDRANLYNVMIYVNNSKKQGISNEEIKKNLRKSGWSSEQIRYIMRKYEGKNTGLYEFGSKDLKKESVSKESEEAPEKNPVKIGTNFSQNPNLGQNKDSLNMGYKI